MNHLVFHNGIAILPESMLDDAVVVCRDGLIEAVGRAAKVDVPTDAQKIDAGGGYIAPGFVDQHVHGALGADFMDGTEEAVRRAIVGHTHHRRGGVPPARGLKPRTGGNND